MDRNRIEILVDKRPDEKLEIVLEKLSGVLKQIERLEKKVEDIWHTQYGLTADLEELRNDFY